MAAHEGLNELRPAPSDDLKRVYSKAKELVEKRGVFILDPAARVLGTYRGLPISDIQPNYTLKVPRDVVLRLAPEAATVLQSVGNVDILYWEPTYFYDIEGNLFYQEPNVAFELEELTPDSYLKNRYLSITIEDDESATSDSHGDLRERVMLEPHQVTPEVMEEWIENVKLQRELGTDRINNAELSVIEKIVDGLAGNT